MERPENIIDLNSDCISLIFNQLEPKDQLSLARSHPVLRDAFAQYNSHRFEEIDESNTYGIEDWRFILPLCGGNVATMAWYGMGVTEIVELAQQFCPNIVEILITICRNDFDEIAKLLPKMQSIEEIWLETMKSDDMSVQENKILESLSQLPKLRVVNLKNFNTNLVSQYVSNLVKLTKLRLYGESNDEFDVLNICKSMKDLHSLVVEPCHLTTKSLKELAIKCPLLEELVLIDMHNTALVPIFPKLKYLFISRAVDAVTSPLFSLINIYQYQHQLEQLTVEHNNITDWNVIGLMKVLKELEFSKCEDSGLQYISQLKQLERLSLCGSTEITNDALLSVLRECKKLRCLDIKYCNKINNEFVYSALNILNENESKEPLELLAHGSGIDPAIKNEFSLQPAAKLLNLSFDKDEIFLISHMELL